MTTNPKIFRKSVRDFINKEFSSCSLYLLVKQPCHELQKGQPGFKLHSTELFYLVLYVLDALKTMPEEEERQLFILDIQQELEEWIYDDAFLESALRKSPPLLERRQEYEQQSLF